jgi:acetyl-CoA carboxylase biotin carboxyl carrier protein
VRNTQKNSSSRKVSRRSSLGSVQSPQGENRSEKPASPAKERAASAASRKSEGSFPLADLEQILACMSQHDVAELEWETPAGRLKLKTQPAVTAAAVLAAGSAFAAGSAQAAHMASGVGSAGFSAPLGLTQGSAGSVPAPGSATAAGAGAFSAAGFRPEGFSAHGSASAGSSVSGGAHLPPGSAAASPLAVKQVLSPFVGTFYRSPSPESAPYVKEGQALKPGDVLCIIEAMKLMNEIEAEFSGKVHSILVENGQPVEFGEPLFTIEV